MCTFSAIRSSLRTRNIFSIFFIMSKNNDRAYYAVGRGRETGIYHTWKECQAHIDGYPQAKYRKFFSFEEAVEFVDFWKNYESPSKPVKESGNSVSNLPNGKGSVKTFGKRGLKRKKENIYINKQRNFVLGAKRGEEAKDLDSDPKTPKFLVAPYTSPISFSFKNTNFHHRRNSPPKNNKKLDIHVKNLVDLVEYKNPNDTVQSNVITFDNSNSDSVSGSLSNKIPETICQVAKAEIATDTSLPNSIDSSKERYNFVEGSNCSTSSNFPQSEDRISENVASDNNCQIIPPPVGITVKKETSSDATDNEQCNDKGASLNSNNDLTVCLGLLESILKVIMNQNNQSSVDVKKSIMLTLQRITSVSNDSINPQIVPEESNTRNCQDSKTCNTKENVDSPERQEGSLSQRQEQHEEQESQSTIFTPVKHSNTSFPSSSYDTTFDKKNVDILALNLRLDSFEKRFDACLKEVGAIVSEISHIKSEIKEMKECTTFNSASSSYKDKKGMLQTTLSFGSPSKGTEKKSNSHFQSSLRSFSSNKDEDDVDEPSAKKGRSLKRKLSRSDSFSKDASCSGENDDIMSRIKIEKVDYTSFSVDDDDYVEVYTDGACHSNGKNGARAGIGIWFGDSHPFNVAEPVEGSPTNNSAEIQAARVAIELAIKAGISKLKIFTDSEFLINCATKWVHRWKRNGWTLVNGGKVKNRRELEKLDKLASKISIRWEKVEAHVGIKGNEMADRLANEGASKDRR